MKIAFLGNADPSRENGGAARITKLQMQMLASVGHEVRLFCPDFVWRIYPAFIRLGFHLADLGSRRSMVKEICAWKPDVLITHNLTGCGFATARAIQSTGARWLHCLHDVQLFEPSGALFDPEPFTLWQRIWSFLRYRALGQPDTVISPTQWLLDQHMRRGFFIHTQAVALPNPLPFPVEIRLSTSYWPPESRPLKLLFVGALTKEKGADFARALAKFMGDGYTITIVSTLTPDQVQEEMRRADLLLVPSRICENQPTVILEAMAVGLPVIASNIGGIPETLGDAGLLCPPDDLQAWGEAIDALRYPVRYVQALDSIAKRVLRHDPQKYVQRLSELLTSNR